MHCSTGYDFGYEFLDVVLVFSVLIVLVTICFYVDVIGHHTRDELRPSKTAAVASLDDTAAFVAMLSSAFRIKIRMNLPSVLSRGCVDSKTIATLCACVSFVAVLLGRIGRRREIHSSTISDGLWRHRDGAARPLDQCSSVLQN